MADARDLPYAALGITQAIGFYTALMPKPAEVRKQDTNNVEFAKDLRTTELVAGGLAVAVATTQSIHGRSVVPLVYSGLVIILMVAMYEYLLQSRKDMSNA